MATPGDGDGDGDGDGGRDAGDELQPARTATIKSGATRTTARIASRVPTQLPALWPIAR
jgi:hypothetical protein